MYFSRNLSIACELSNLLTSDCSYYFFINFFSACRIYNNSFLYSWYWQFFFLLWELINLSILFFSSKNWFLVWLIFFYSIVFCFFFFYYYYFLPSAYFGFQFPFSLVAQSCQTLCNPMDCSTPGLLVLHQLPRSTQTHGHWVGDAMQPV